MIDQAEIELRRRIDRLNTEVIDLREWLRRRREIVKSTADKLFDAEKRLAAVRQQLADYQMAQRAAKDRVVKECLTTEFVSVEIVGM